MVINTATARLWASFLGGGSLVLGFGLCCNVLGKQNTKRNLLFGKSLCETSQESKPQLLEKIKQARSLVERVKEEKGCPGLTISVSLNGKTVWSEGLGYSDVENDVRCKPTTVMRIASISKPLTATAAMKLLEEGKLNLDDPVQKYVPIFPEKVINSKKSVITVRHLLSHLSGIRHYHERKKENKDGKPDLQETDIQKKTQSDSDMPEYYIKQCYDTMAKSLSLFKDDPLVHEPGSEYLYTTFGWTLLSAVVENASQQEFLKYMDGLFNKLGMTQTQAELHEKLIYNRARFYVRDGKGKLQNTPFVDNCYKWAGGGFLSTTEDLLKFGNAMLYSSQVGNYEGSSTLLPGILSPESVSLSWKIVEKTENKVCKKGGYGLGWMIFPNKHEHGCCRDQQKAVFHTGGAVGASSVLLILPETIQNCLEQQCSIKDHFPPRGVVVAILVNMGDVQLSQTALEIAELFRNSVN